jgi:TRAP-type C4-dicarboxylate transport system permease small subunit
MAIHKFERRHEKLAPMPVFIKRVAVSFGVACGLIFFALMIGVFGYHWLAGLGWIDALLDASMILGGMGPVHELRTDCAKIFASCYALFPGLVFIGVMALVLSPLVHRMLHRFHADEKDLK